MSLKLVKFREIKEVKHSIKIEDLDMTREHADKIEIVLYNFLTDLGYSKDRIEALECRSRDGFAAYSHNKGGLGAISYLDRHSLPNGSLGFPNADKTIERYEEIELEDFKKDHNLGNYSDWTEEMREAFSELLQSDQASDILLSVDMMLTSETELNIRMCVCVKDAPYHRKYDDLLEFDIEFKTLKSLETQLKKLLKDKGVSQFKRNLRDAY